MVGRFVGVLGVVLYVLAGWLYLGSGLVMPYPWALTMWVLWVGGFWLLASVYRRRRTLTPLVALAAVAVWVGVVSLGSWLFGWTA